MDLSNIKWQRGTFQKFQAKMKIRLGGANPVDIYEGDEIEYDGTILKYGGAEIATAQTRGAFKNGWFTVVGGRTGSAGVRSVLPGRNVASATSVNRDLNNVQRSSGKGIHMDSLDEQTVFDVADRRGSEPNAKPNVLQGGQRRFAVTDEGSSEGVVIGSVRSPARVKIDDTTKISNQQIRSIEEQTVGQPIFNENARRTVHREGVSIKMNVGSVDPNSIVADEDEGVPVGRVRRTAAARSEGVTVEDTSDIRSRPKAARAAAPKLDSKLPPKVRIARAIDPDFPASWSFEGKLADRLAAVKAHGVNKRFINALYAAEGDQMRKQLEKHYARHLG